MGVTSYLFTHHTSSSQSSGTDSLGNCAGDTVRERLDPTPKVVDCAEDTVRERLDPAPNIELWETGTTTSDDEDVVLGFGANTEEWVLCVLLAAAAAAADDIDAPEATTEVHPRCVVGVGALEEDPRFVWVVVFHDLVAVVAVVAVAGGTAAVGRQDGEEDDEVDWVALTAALKSASFPRPKPAWGVVVVVVGVIKAERSGVGIRVSMRRMICTLIIINGIISIQIE